MHGDGSDDIGSLVHGRHSLQVRIEVEHDPASGERQRIGVARVLLADRPIMLFDEPTAHLDAATSSALATELLATTAGRTALIVTHRPEQTPGLAEVRFGTPACRLPRRQVRSAPVITSRTVP